MYWKALNKNNRKLLPDKDQLAGFYLIQDGFALGGQNPYSGKQTGYPDIKLTANYLSWYIGEIHIIEDALHPNLKRDGFEESEDSRKFIEQLRKWYAVLEQDTRVISYVRDAEKKYKDFDALIQKISTQPMLIEDTVDIKRLIDADKRLKEDEEVTQKQLTRRFNGVAITPHERGALTNKDVRSYRRKLIAKILPLKKHMGISEIKLPELNLVQVETPVEEETDRDITKFPVAESNETENWNEANNTFSANVKVDVFISILENVLEEEALKPKQSKSIVQKVQTRINSVMRNDQQFSR